MSFEKKYNKIKTAFIRLGIPLEETDEDVTFEESAIVSAVLANPNNTKTITEKAIQDHEALLIGKIRKNIEAQGVEVGEEQDIKKLMELSKTHLLKTAGEGKEDIVKKNSELQTQLQELKVLQQQKEQEFANQLETVGKEKDVQVGRVKRNYDVTLIASKKNLTDTAKAVLNEIVNDNLSPKLDQFDIREEKGKKVIYSKDGVMRFKSDILGGEYSSEPATIEDFVDFELQKFGHIKQTDSTGGGNPDAGAATPVPQGEQAYDPSAGII